VEAYLRKLYAWGPEFTLTFSTLRQTGIPGLSEITVEVARGDQKNSGTIFVSRDGRYLFRGELSDLTKDPLAETRAMLHLEDSPALGPADAPVTLVEFADFQCPACRQLHDGLKPLLARYPQVRLVFKDFPISQIHPWARTAALAGRCVYMQTPSAFWKFYDSVYENQKDISPENAWEKALEYASQAGVNPEGMKTCMAGPEAAQAVDKSLQLGQELAVSSTPTVFVNGRRAVGPDAALIEQYIQFELQSSAAKAKKTN
jgi:protein-disulfide isomerase